MTVNRFFRFLKAFRDHDPDDMLLYRTAGKGATLTVGDIRATADYIELLELAIDDFADAYEKKIKQYNQLVDDCYDLQQEMDKLLYVISKERK